MGAMLWRWAYGLQAAALGALAAVIPPGHVVGGQRQELLAASVGPVTAMSYAESWDQLFVAGDLGTVQSFRGSDLSLFQGGNAGSRVTALTWHGLNGLDEVIAGAVDGRMIFLQSSNLQSVATVNENSGGSQVNAIVYVSYSDDVTSYAEVATCSYFSSNIQLWSASGKTKTRELPGHTNIVLSLTGLENLQMLASGSMDGFLGLWQLPLARLQAEGQICSGTLAPLPTSYLLEDCIKEVMKVANPAGGDFFIYGQAGSSSANECQMLENVGSCSSLVAAPYTMYRLQVPLKHLVPAHGGPVRALAPLPQQLVASGGDDGTLRSWNPSTGHLVRDFGDGQRALESGVTALAYSSTLEALVVATLQQIAFFDVTSGSLLSRIERSTSSPALAVTMDNHGLVVSSKGTELEAWPQLTLCADGFAPSSFSRCDACVRTAPARPTPASAVAPRPRAATGAAPRRRKRRGRRRRFRHRRRALPCRKRSLPATRAPRPARCGACARGVWSSHGDEPGPACRLSAPTLL